MNIATCLSLALLPSLSGIPSQRGGPPPGPQQEIVEREARVAWYGIWEDAKAEAERSGRPILLMSAAPRCNDVPGMW